MVGLGAERVIDILYRYHNKRIIDYIRSNSPGLGLAPNSGAHTSSKFIATKQE